MVTIYKNVNMKIELTDRTEYRCEGKLHRTDGPAVEKENGVREWYFHGERHRTNGPAFEYTKSNGESTGTWFMHGRLHRSDGPVIERPDGNFLW